MTEDLAYKIEMFSNIKDKLEVAELVLKTLKIKYEIVPPKTHTSNLLKSLYEKPLVNDILASINNGLRINSEQIKKDFEVRRYWRKQFQKFQDFQEFSSTN
ncbi:hypothetical protein LCGC14_0679270 [marine sediment metagenome]|uniref:Uncharacterized protein n=1 Tax=marine sediment metagenome TaxID=412755 RepID=A0A0F9QTS1_9ZZZZ|nr:MAG: hypothetical protein Lokiarch_06160 [Candidatus Lokiarchaeum sp. GC14_75]